MDQLLTGNIWEQISKLLTPGTPKLAAVAYVTSSEYLPFRKDDVLLCDASDNAIKSGQTSAQTLKRLFNCGVRLFSCADLHAKALVSGEIAVIGSPNLSASSASSLIEASLVTRRFQPRSQVRAFIQKLMRISKAVDAKFITRALELPVSVRFRGKAARCRPIEQPSNRTWVVSTVPLSERIQERESEFEDVGEQTARERVADIEGDIYPIRWAGKGKFRANAKEGDSIIELRRNRQRNRCQVIQPRPIVFRQNHDKWTRFYIDDATTSRSFSWRVFSEKLKKAGIKGISMNSTRELTPGEAALMELIWADH